MAVSNSTASFKVKRLEKGVKRGRKRLQGSELNIFRPFFFLLFFRQNKNKLGRFLRGFLQFKFSSDLCDCVGFRHHHARVAVFHQVWNLFLPLPSFLPRSVGRSTALADIVSHLPLISPVVVVAFSFSVSISSLIFWLSSENYCDVESVTTCGPCVSVYHRLLGSATRIFQSNRRTSSSTVDQLIELTGHVVVV